ncbi:MAG: hypothetical protein M5U26_00310 [Planctomycetota bacterium]|nr:hypothetical protein [Planctomycetota bacterium]
MELLLGQARGLQRHVAVPFRAVRRPLGLQKNPHHVRVSQAVLGRKERAQCFIQLRQLRVVAEGTQVEFAFVLPDRLEPLRLRAFLAPRDPHGLLALAPQIREQRRRQNAPEDDETLAVEVGDLRLGQAKAHGAPSFRPCGPMYLHFSWLFGKHTSRNWVEFRSFSRLAWIK